MPGPAPLRDSHLYLYFPSCLCAFSLIPNIVIDAAVPARPSHEVALRLLSDVDRGRISGLVAPTSLATCWYVATTHHEVDPRPLFETLEVVFDFALMNRTALRVALNADPEADFEDVFLAAAGNEAGAECVLRRH